ncbi:MAG: cupin domain-containing protein [Chloroflexi bacterium]|nr:cupin domain-containing protein [Chloroflexota bacterium]
MSTKPKIVFKLADVPLLESPDHAMRDCVMVSEETCSSQQYSAGLFFVRPGTKGHADKHVGQEELYYIFQGRGTVVVDDEPHKLEAGDVVFIPDGLTHYLINDGPQPLGLFWAIAKKWSDLPGIQQELAKWRTVRPDAKWGS